MQRLAWVLGSLSAFAGVAAGAFGAHALRTRIAPELLAVYDTGVRYQLLHALALLLVGLAAARWPAGGWSGPVWLFAAGTVLFSGSLYALAISGVRWLGAITPLGGLCFLAGWALLLLAGLRSVD
ncbi:MAG: DUF423 domain-containing protein [Gemmatimonadota bacterium]